MGAQSPARVIEGSQASGLRSRPQREALLAAVTVGQRPTEGDGVACYRVAQQKMDPVAARRREGLHQQQRGQRVQAIALCERLGLNYSTKNDSPTPCRRKRLKKLPPPPTLPPPLPPVPETSPPPNRLSTWVADNAKFLATHGWHKLNKSRRGWSELSEQLKDLPHNAAAYLDYLRRCGTPVMTSGVRHTPEELQAAVDRGLHPSVTKEAEFLFKEVYKMCKRRHAMVIPFSVVKCLRGVRISPPRGCAIA